MAARPGASAGAARRMGAVVPLANLQRALPGARGNRLQPGATARARLVDRCGRRVADALAHDIGQRVLVDLSRPHPLSAVPAGAGEAVQRRTGPHRGDRAPTPRPAPGPLLRPALL